MLTALESPAPFAVLEAMQVTLSPERQRQLAALATPLTITDYRQLDLPVVVGRLSAEAESRLSPDSSLGYFVTRGRSVAVHHADNQAIGNAEKLLREQLVTDPWRASVSFKDAVGKDQAHFRPNAYLLTRLNAKIMTQKPIVASILRFDAETFGASPAKVMLDFHQDRPGPQHVLSAGWHRDDALSSQRAARMMRVYLLRSAAPTEFLRDSIVLRDDGRRVSSLGNLARMHEAPPSTQAAWLAHIKAASMFFQPQPYEVALMTADHTRHRSHRPEQPVNSTFMRLAIQPQI